MFKKIPLAVFMAALSYLAPLTAAAFDFTADTRPLAFAEMKVPAVSAPVPAAATPKLCKPFLLSVSVGGVDETVILERACTPDNAPVWALMVEARGGRRPISVKVSSENYPAEKAAIENRIKSMVVDGVSQEDADFIVGKTGPALKLALAAAPAEREKILAEAAEALKAHLARP